MTATADLRGTGGVLVDDQSATSAPAIGEVNRYPGSPPFADTDIDRMLFRGRAVETDEVLHSILSYDLLLVYAVSGMGKTSLLTAGVLEPLRQRDYFPVIVRLNSPDTGMLGLIEQQIRQAADATPGLELIHTPTVGAAATPPSTLWDLFAELELWRGNTLQQLVLVFDQFEELFTLPWDADERARFIEQFGEVVRRHRIPGRGVDPARQALPPPNVKVVLCMREDFLGQLEELAVSVPQIMHRRFRLGALTPEQAQAAICEPAALDDPRLRTQRFSYSAGAAFTVLTFLRTKDERGKAVVTDAIDPSQLQIICQHVERSILPGKSAGPDGVVEITEGDLGGQEGLRRIVGDFYRRVLEEFQPKERKAIRHLCETGLISQTGRRLSQEEGEIYNHFDVSSDTLRQLVDLRLLRSEPRVGSVYYELAHDTLTGPILSYRDVKRRGRRRRLVIAGLTVAGVAAIVIAALVLAGRTADTGTAVPPPIEQLAVGSSVTGSLSSANDSTLYEVSAGDSPLIVTLRPSEFDGSLMVAPLADLGAASEPVNERDSSDPEYAVIPSGPGEFRLTVSGTGPGAFELAVRDADARSLALGDEIEDIRLPTTGEPVVFELESADDQLFVVSITGTASDSSPGKVRGTATVEISGASASATQRQTLQATNPVWSTVEGGSPGRYTIVLRGSAENTTVSYGVSVSEADVAAVSVGDTETVPLDGAGQRAVFEIRPPAATGALVGLQDLQGESQGAIQAPDGGVIELDPGSYAMLNGGVRYLAFITSEVPDVVTLSVDAPEAIDVAAGETRNGRLDDTARIALYRVASSGEALLLGEVMSDDSLDAELALLAPDGTLFELVDNEGTDAAEHIAIPASEEGPLFLAVIRFEETSGSFELSVRAPDVDEIAVESPVTQRVDAADVAFFTYAAGDTEDFLVNVSSEEGIVDLVTVTAPDGSEFVVSGDEGSAYIDAGQIGMFVIEVETFDAGDFEISVEPA
jgi:Novel STAND NTPase 1